LGRSILATAAFQAAVWASDADTFLLRNADIFPVTSPEIINASILVRNGRIASVGSAIAAPKGVRIVEGKGLRVYPGMIDSATELGLAEISDLRVTVDTGELGVFMPQLRALTAVNPDSEHFPVIRANGITSVVTFPSPENAGRSGGERQILAGQAALIHTDGWTWEEMAVNGSAAVHLIFPSLPRDQSGFAGAKRAYDREIQQIGDFFDQARRYRVAKLASGPGFKPDLKLEAMIPAIEGRAPVAISASRETEILDAIQFADRQKIRMVLLEPRELGKAAAELKSRNMPVVLGRTLELPLNEDDPYDAAFALPAQAFRAGLKIALGTFDNEFVRDLPYNAAAAVAYGLPYEEALKAVTVNPAEIWGAGTQLGSLAEGKWADLMLTDGDPFETRTAIKAVFVKGREVDLTNRQTRLYQKYLNRP
jgi:imidazolonepropionase-like amidohydrolase